MKLLNFSKLFRKNTNSVTLDEFAVAKLELGTAIFEKLKNYFKDRVSDNYSIYDKKYKKTDLVGNLAVNDYSVQFLREFDEHAQKLVALNKDYPDLHKKAGDDYKMYRKPFADQINQTILPWFEESMKKLDPKWREKCQKQETSERFYDTTRHVRDDITKEELVVTRGQNNVIMHMLMAYHSLAYLTPEDISLEELQDYGMDMVNSGSFSDLYDMLSKKNVSENDMSTLFTAPKPQ